MPFSLEVSLSAHFTPDGTSAAFITPARNPARNNTVYNIHNLNSTWAMFLSVAVLWYSILGMHVYYIQ